MPLPLTTQTRTDFRVAHTIGQFQHHAGLNQMGQFPLPNESTIVAAELLARSLAHTNAPNLGAIGVAEISDTGTTTYIAVSSGFGLVPGATINDWAGRLSALLGNQFHRVEGMGLNSHAIFYSPAHLDTIAFITRALPQFHGTTHPISVADVNAAALALRGLPNAPFGLQANGQIQVQGLTPCINAIRLALACAIGVRIDAAGNQGARQQVLTRLETLIDALDRHAYPDREALGRNLQDLAFSGGHPGQFRFRENPQVAISANARVQAVLTDAWRVADLNRFCAEPKLFTYIGNSRFSGSLTGQVALWWDNSRPNRYRLNGNPGAGADYMLPCTSCQSRSMDMLRGITVGAAPQVSQEAPDVVVRTQPRVLQRRNSIG